MTSAPNAARVRPHVGNDRRSWSNIRCLEGHGPTQSAIRGLKYVCPPVRFICISYEIYFCIIFFIKKKNRILSYKRDTKIGDGKGPHADRTYSLGPSPRSHTGLSAQTVGS